MKLAKVTSHIKLGFCGHVWSDMKLLEPHFVRGGLVLATLDDDFIDEFRSIWYFYCFGLWVPFE